MPGFDPILAEIRFGCGLSPEVAPPADLAQMLARLGEPDRAAARFPIEDFEAFGRRMAEMNRIRRARRKLRGQEGFEAINKEYKLARADARRAMKRWIHAAMMRRAHTGDGLRERLTAFWADHFTAIGKGGVLRRGTAPYIETAIRPHVAGRFGDMLKAVMQAPVMLSYLDQFRSMGPESYRVAQKGARGQGKFGLNENLAREVLELHTLGVDGPYGQADVRQLAELMTGLSYDVGGAFKFKRDFAEPGAETVLGKRYGGAAKAQAGEVFEVFDDLAVHPATAAHLARKLVVHFCGDAPDEAHVAHVMARYTASGGDLAQVTEALLEHPAAWDRERLGNVKQPVDFVGSAMRALAVPEAAVDTGDEKALNTLYVMPFGFMGQAWQHPIGPDGWPEEDGEWITPQRLAARLDWAMTAPSVLRPDLPDPRDFLRVALGGRASEELQFAARAAEDRRTGVGIILASPGFQRM